MVAAERKPVQSPARVALTFFRDLLADCHPRDFAIRLWDGSTLPSEPGQSARFTLAIHKPGALRRMFFPPSELALAEAYLRDDFDIEGDIEAVYSLGEYILGSKPLGPSRMARLARDYAAVFLAMPGDDPALTSHRRARLGGERHSIERDRRAVTFHYDVSNDFYSLWLDQRMVYSCAYFGSPGQGLEAAQERKLDYICRKLRLQPGQRLLDIGCGWGGLAIHAASRFGADVTGITLSQPQADLANQRIAEAGLSDRCRVEVRDYREIDDPEGFDRLVSVGMFEHVGLKRLPEYMTRAWRLLKPGGVFLNHGIAIGPGRMNSVGDSFSQRYVFPDGELVPVSTTLKAAEESGFEVRDVESLREHYMLTLRHWVRRLEAKHEEALRFVDEPTYRVWRLYMSGSADGFRAGRLNIYQSLLAKPENGAGGLPLTREDWYRAQHGPG